MGSPDVRANLRDFARVYGVHVPGVAVCRGHSAPLDFLCSWVQRRPSVSVVLGPRGGGKSYLAAFATFVDSAFRPGHGTRILGGSLAQSQQIYEALGSFVRADAGRNRIRVLTKTAATFRNGSDVSMLAASTTSVRGPHVPTLRLDEIDEIDPGIREAAMGMCMARGGVPASVSMTSTWHRIGGPMAELIDRGRAGEFPFFSFCAFEVLERCPESRSGANLEHCPACPLVRWCHDTPGGVPRAKRSDGHYAIDSLIQKVKTVSLRVFEADYLCTGPRADGLWFPAFAEATHVGEDAEFDPALPVHLAVDSGVFTGAVLYQVRRPAAGRGLSVHVFADYLAEGLTVDANARELLELARVRCLGRLDYRSTDPAGGARNPVGPTVLALYAEAGLPLDPWPHSGVADGLATIEGLVQSASGAHRLRVHPRCRTLIGAFRSYERKKRGGQWMDYPRDPQHPWEDVMDALRGGLVADSLGAATYGPHPFGEGYR